MKIEINFEDYIKSRISGTMIMNISWYEYLLNLFFQGYLCELADEIDETITNTLRNFDYVYELIGETL